MSQSMKLLLLVMTGLVGTAFSPTWPLKLTPSYENTGRYYGADETKPFWTLYLGSPPIKQPRDVNQSIPDFSGYPQVKGFLYCIGIHTNANWNLQHTNFLVISEFYRMDCVGCDVLQYFVSEGGREFDYHDEGGGVITKVRLRQLSRADFQNLHQAIDDLPATNQFPWLSTLVIISHREGTNWVVHSYARSSDDIQEFPALRKMFEIIGERPEAGEVHPF
jgi:hypothetical protein